MNKSVIGIFAGVVIVGTILVAVEAQPTPKTMIPIPTTIVVTQPPANTIVQSPLLIRGRARGNWYFEGVFPVKLLDGQDQILAQGQARAQGEWMTQEFVSFQVELQFASPQTVGGTLVLEKDNPSGRAANEDSFRVPVRFKD